MNNAIFTGKTLKKLLDKYGSVLNFGQIKSILDGNYSLQKLRKLASTAVEYKQLTRIKRGLYLANSKNTNKQFTHLLTASNLINNESYISFEGALAYHSLYSSWTSIINAVTSKRARKYGKINFLRTKKEYISGFSTKDVNGTNIRIAYPEKALADMIYFRFKDDRQKKKICYKVLKKKMSKLNVSRLENFTIMYGDACIRRMGFLLEYCGLKSKKLYNAIKCKNAYSNLYTPKKHDKIWNRYRKFDKHWRIYYNKKQFNKINSYHKPSYKPFSRKNYTKQQLEFINLYYGR